MRTTIDLPEEVLRRAKITAVERGSSLRQLVIDALKHEIEAPSRTRRQRLLSPPVKLAADSPLRTLGPDEVKRLDTEAQIEAEVARVNALHR
jgi:hypothetical protein